MLIGASTFAQIQDEKNVTVTMELVPVLQLNMNTTDQVNFVFDEISEYVGGITKYGATILTVSSSVNWDLFASGTSAAHTQTPANRLWDAQVAYGTVAATNAPGGPANQLPLTALELRQFPSVVANLSDGAGTHADYYNLPFVSAQGTPVGGQNNVYVSAGSPYVAPPAADENYIAGGFGTVDYVDGGSYLTEQTVAGVSPYYYVIDYRIVPGLPAIFPFAHDEAAAQDEDLVTAIGAGAYAKPGVYTMNVKYLLIENQ
jgi:hypothetical protein